MLPGDIYYSRRNESNDAFIEKRLVPVANQFVICGPCGDLTTFTGSAAYQITSSWSINADVSVSSSYALSSSYAPSAGGQLLETGSLYPITSSWSIDANTSVSSSYAMSASWAPSVESQWLVTSSLYPVTSSWAESASWAPQQPVISSSYSATSSFALNSSAGGTSLTTSSLYPITSSWAITSSNSISASYAPSVDGQWLVTGSLYPITSSWSTTSSNVVGDGTIQGSTYQVTGSIFNYQTDTYTLTNDDNGRIVSIANNNSSVNLNISRSLDSTFNCMIYQSGSGQVAFITESGVNIRSRSGASQTSGQYAIATILRVSSTDFIVAGDISI
jgi:hypothetical protein